MNEKKTKILVIDDEQGIRDLFYLLLQPIGFEVITAKDGIEGIETFKKDNFDIVFLDVHMPGLQGPSVLKKIKEIKPDQIVVIFSSSSDPNFVFEEEATKKLGAYTCLYKPFDIKGILKIINEIQNKNKTEAFLWIKNQ
ncbi:MAG: response regulator [Endomicrobiia bacterium]